MGTYSKLYSLMPKEKCEEILKLLPPKFTTSDFQDAFCLVFPSDNRSIFILRKKCSTIAAINNWIRRGYMLTMTRAKMFKKDPHGKPDSWVKDVNLKAPSITINNIEYPLRHKK